ncbi:GNAT family N-acetyltransferase [Ligilactobacillus apodemi]|uniref:Polyamine N-acetyltransferase n=1 Tax=Ligilactobacillus apodemi DSM 16634 = JCM 16172 TaxID=1423724 RepID=A0A0R1U132_9LACO|nr:GNAT family N-acetyltransferase [Ligilactobacillus apodemi]KRL87119.1 polyamine N-acetyltransferase [Ligilactobacillus apodemi DSM 16634 = JCM 16172]
MQKRLQKITSTDVKVLQALSIETFSETFADQNDPKALNDYLQQAYDLAKLTHELKDPNSSFYFIYAADKLAGYLKVNVKDAQTEDLGQNALEIERIYLKKEFKRQGLGKMLFEKALALAAEKSCTKIWLGVWEKNYPALAFYEKMGFKQSGAHSFFMGEEKQTDYIMVKELNN